MRLSTLIREELILVDLPGEQLSDGINALLDLLAGELGPEKIEAVRAQLDQRRTETNDYLTGGVAIPHARVEGLDKFYVCVGNSATGLGLSGPAESATSEEERVYLVFLILTPQTQITLMLQALAAIARLCHNQDVRRALQKCKTPARILKMIEERNVEVKRAVTASDAMRSCDFCLSPDDDLAETLRKMVRSDEGALPVVDAEGKLRGCVTPAALFKLGLPKYVEFLSDVEFLKNFEPFEQILVNEKTMKVSQIASSDAPLVRSDAPILQVAHMMVTKPTSTVFVVGDDGAFKGLIHENDILAKVLMP